jgi:hypothetical protein
VLDVLFFALSWGILGRVGDFRNVSFFLLSLNRNKMMADKVRGEIKVVRECLL